MTWSKTVKPASSFSGVVKPTTSWEKEAKMVGFLLQENGGYLLLETGGKIIISGFHSPGWGKEAKP